MNRRNERGHGGEKIAKVRRIKRLFERRETPVDQFWCSSCSLRTNSRGLFERETRGGVESRDGGGVSGRG